MNVLIVSSECDPLVKVGGLADVVGSLPKALINLGVNPVVVIPAYKPLIDQNPNLFKQLITNTDILYSKKNELVSVYKTNIPNTKVPVYLLKNEKYLSNKGIYFDPSSFASNQEEIERFAFFSKAVDTIFIENTIDNLNFDIVHCNDWHTGMIPHLVKKRSEKSSNVSGKSNMYKRPRTVFTIHNLSNQGFSSIDVIQKFGENINKSKLIEWDALDNNIDFILQGIVSADYINTVSPNYAAEIQTPWYGEGLDQIIKSRGSRISGILNGIDYSIWNPKTDTKIYKQYDKNSLEIKKENKIGLLKELNLLKHAPSEDAPVISLISRLTYQKGIDLVNRSLKEILDLGVYVIILGTGDPSLENKLRMSAQELKKQGYANISLILEFNSDLARKIYAGSDMFLIPSRFEPCGLTQMIAMRYGTIPIVRKTGGLADTVESGVTGFLFEKFNHLEFIYAIKRAISYYKNKSAWHTIILNAMIKDFSWKESAKKYVELYKITANLLTPPL